MAVLELLHTEGCHLCDLALNVVEQAVSQYASHIQEQVGDLYLEMVDIAESDAMIGRYGIRIPVLRFSFEEKVVDELDWPFDSAQFMDFLLRAATPVGGLSHR